MKANSFIPLVISSVFATVISRWHLGNELAFNILEYSFIHPTELFFYLGLGIIRTDWFINYKSFIWDRRSIR